MIGEVTVHKKYLDGAEESVAGTNRIMSLTKARMIAALVCEETDSPDLLDPVVEMRVGSGGLGNKITGLESSLFNELTTGYDPTSIQNNRPAVDLTKTHVDYLLVIDPSSLNGTTIDEVGLITQSGKLFSMKILDPIEKDSTFSLIFSWKVSML